MNNFGRGTPNTYLVLDSSSLGVADLQTTLNNAALDGWSVVTVRGDNIILVRTRLPLTETPYDGDGSEYTP